MFYLGHLCSNRENFTFHLLTFIQNNLIKRMICDVLILGELTEQGRSIIENISGYHLGMSTHFDVLCSNYNCTRIKSELFAVFKTNVGNQDLHKFPKSKNA